MPEKFEVRWVYQLVHARGKAFESGQRPALCFRGHKHALCVAAGHPVRVLKRPVEAYDRYRQVMNVPALDGVPTPRGEEPRGSEPYRVTQAVTQLREIGARNGVTKGAEALLDRAALWAEGQRAEVDEDDYHDEEELTTMENPTPVSEATGETTTQEKPVKTKKTSSAKSKPAAKKAATKTAKRGAPAKAAKATGRKAANGSGPRAGSMTELVVKLAREKKDSKAIGNAVAKAFPSSSFAKEVKQGDYHAVGYYVGMARKRGWLPKAAAK